MDWISITTGCFAVSNAIAKATLALGRFVRDVRVSRADLTALSAELHALDGVLDLLKDDAASAAFPADVALQTPGVIAGCGAVVADLDGIFDGSLAAAAAAAAAAAVTSAGPVDALPQQQDKRATWRTMRRHVQRSRAVLEVYRLTLGLALDLVALTTSTGDGNDDDDNDGNETGPSESGDASLFPSDDDTANDIARILAEAGHLRARIRSGFQENDVAFTLQNYLNVLQQHAHTALQDPRPQQHALAGTRTSRDQERERDRDSVTSPTGHAPDSAVEMDDEPTVHANGKAREQASFGSRPSTPRGDAGLTLPMEEIEDLLDELRDQVPSRPPTPPPRSVGRLGSSQGIPSRASSSRLSSSSPTSTGVVGDGTSKADADADADPNDDDDDTCAALPPPFGRPTAYEDFVPSPTASGPPATAHGNGSSSGGSFLPSLPPSSPRRTNRLHHSRSISAVSSSTTATHSSSSSSSRFGRFFSHLRSTSATTASEAAKRPSTASGASTASTMQPLRPSPTVTTSLRPPPPLPELQQQQPTRTTRRFSGSIRHVTTPLWATPALPNGGGKNIDNSHHLVFGKAAAAAVAAAANPEDSDHEPDAVFGVSLRKSIRVAGASARTHHAGSHGASVREFPLCVFKCYTFLTAGDRIRTPNLFGGGMESDGFEGDLATGSSGSSSNNNNNNTNGWHTVNEDRVRALRTAFATAPTYGAELDLALTELPGGIGRCGPHDAAALLLQYLAALRRERAAALAHAVAAGRRARLVREAARPRARLLGRGPGRRAGPGGAQLAEAAAEPVGRRGRRGGPQRHDGGAAGGRGVAVAGARGPGARAGRDGLDAQPRVCDPEAVRVRAAAARRRTGKPRGL
ncbi:rhogap protein [Niveomyces insectorum RCEF 264]|uniref:Rhogap protein n=1 Tax=Niveomyces insectorum RCEF 264 TaxID=1081102 RepID=A0A167QDA8_9HYPO|nr:rhogap protein [Niveomyces insectorum RCEF 264]